MLVVVMTYVYRAQAVVDNTASLLDLQVNPVIAEKANVHISQVLLSLLDVLLRSNKLYLFTDIKTIYHTHSGALQHTEHYLLPSSQCL